MSYRTISFCILYYICYISVKFNVSYVNFCILSLQFKMLNVLMHIINLNLAKTSWNIEKFACYFILMHVCSENWIIKSKIKIHIISFSMLSFFSKIFEGAKNYSHWQFASKARGHQCYFCFV